MQGTPVVVLHVEDDESVASGLATLLRSANYVVVTAKDGATALEYIVNRGLRPDVLIVDFMLPGEMDGADVAQAICSHLHHVVPVIMLSGQLSSASLPWLPGAPLMCAWKPMDPEILLKAVESFADLGRFMRERLTHATGLTHA